MVNENAIREKLSETLDLLEPGLALVEVNHKLPNELGGKGFVDILARDLTGKFVIIELKRSDDSARSALFEILKYMPLFRRLHGILASQVRCFVVSTTWHELRVPFSEFRRLCETQTEGFAIEVDDAGFITRVERIPVDSDTPPPRLFGVHCVYLYETRRRRTEAVAQVAAVLVAEGAQGYLLFELDYYGGSPHVVTPYAIYAVPTLLTNGLFGSLVEEAVVELTDPDGDEPDRADLEALAENTFLSGVNNALVSQSPRPWDALEIGYPEKFTTVTRTGWTPSHIHRHGPYCSTLVFPDKEIVKLVTGVSGQNVVHFERLSSPKHQLDWASVGTDAMRCLRGNRIWEGGFAWFTDRSADQFHDGNFRADVYNPQMLLETLYQLGRNQRVEYVPSINLLIVAEDGGRQEHASGTVVWDGSAAPSSVKEVFDGMVDGIEEYLWHYHMGTTWEIDEELMRRHGLQYSFWWTEQGDGVPHQSRYMTLTESGIHDAGPHGPTLESMRDYFATARSYLNDLFRAMDAVIHR
jgi:hypothetical protein